MSLDDASLIAAIPGASLANCHALVTDAVRRRLAAAVPALESLCRRFRGFGLHHAVPEQVAALTALAALGGRGAGAAAARIIVDDVVQGPGLASAISAAQTDIDRMSPPDQRRRRNRAERRGFRRLTLEAPGQPHSSG